MTMRDFSCFRDGAVTTISAASSGAGDHLDRSLQAATACVYRAELSSSRKELIVTVTWTRSIPGTEAADGTPGLSVAIEDVAPPKPKLLPPSSALKTVPTTPRRSTTLPAASAQQRGREPVVRH